MADSLRVGKPIKQITGYQVRTIRQSLRPDGSGGGRRHEICPWQKRILGGEQRVNSSRQATATREIDLLSDLNLKSAADVAQSSYLAVARRIARRLRIEGG